MLGIPLEARFLHVALPVGISFYTFQSMAYTIDVYRGRLSACRNLGVFALYVAFFPQLVAGPIERSDEHASAVCAQVRLRLRPHSLRSAFGIVGVCSRNW